MTSFADAVRQRAGEVRALADDHAALARPWSARRRRRPGATRISSSRAGGAVGDVVAVEGLRVEAALDDAAGDELGAAGATPPLEERLGERVEPDREGPDVPAAEPVLGSAAPTWSTISRSSGIGRRRR